MEKRVKQKCIQLLNIFIILCAGGELEADLEAKEMNHDRFKA